MKEFALRACMWHSPSGAYVRLLKIKALVEPIPSSTSYKSPKKRIPGQQVPGTYLKRTASNKHASHDRYIQVLHTHII